MCNTSIGRNRARRRAIARALPLAVTLVAAALSVMAAPVSAASRTGFPDVVTDDQGDNVPLVRDRRATPLFVDQGDYPGVRRAAADLQADVERVSGVRPDLATDRPPAGDVAVLVGTLGHSPLVDGLVRAGKVDATAVAGKWESFVIATVTDPLPGVGRAVVVAGSDRRGTIFGLYELSEQVGVSPWYWWADVPPRHHDSLSVRPGAYVQGPPGVRYRGIFINDEDWGLNPWAAKTFDPQFGNVGPKTYAKVFELMLRLRLNYLWPAMHACSTEFGSVPGNVALADEYGIVAGSSHCEPMLFNNVHWDPKANGPWNYSTNRDAIHATWERNVEARGPAEAVWTLGIRGIHDAPMQAPPKDMPGKLRLVTEVFRDQRALIDRYVDRQWGPVAQCFVPYKEVLPIYDAGLPVPDDVTLVWVDDNFGYIRRLGAAADRKRAGGAGVYWHLSYYGLPHSYTWVNTTPPALMWEELHKAWDNDAGRLWVLNVGDIKPAEIGIDYYARLAWSPDAVGPDSQPAFLHDWAARTFGDTAAQPTADLLATYYRLGTIRKPELMSRSWARSLPADRADQLARDYADLLKREADVAARVPPAAWDAYAETVGLPAQVLAEAGLIFMADRAGDQREVARLRDELAAQVERFNTRVAGGKWNRMMPGLVTGKDLAQWSSQVRWPWGEKKGAAAPPPLPPARAWRDAATADRRQAAGRARWTVVAGLGTSGRAVALEPAGLASAWAETDAAAPTLEFDFTTAGDGDGGAAVDFLPTFRLCPGMRLRVTVGVDDRRPVTVEVPGSGGAEDERGRVRSDAVQDNFVRATVPLPDLAPGRHVLKVRAVDPGIVIDRVAVP